MTRAEKRHFVRDLFRDVKRSVLANVALMPDEWDGHELRRYIADQFEASATTIKPGTKDPAFRRRLREYRNTIATTGNL